MGADDRLPQLLWGQPQLHVHLATYFFQDFADGLLVFGFAGKRAVQIDQMQTPRPFADPAARHDRGVFAKGGGLVHIALFEANAVTVF